MRWGVSTCRDGRGEVFRTCRARTSGRWKSQGHFRPGVAVQRDLLTDPRRGRMVAQNHRTFGEPHNTNKGVIVVEGRMIERLHFSMAQRTVEIAEQIRAMQSGAGDAYPAKAGSSFSTAPSRTRHSGLRRNDAGALAWPCDQAITGPSLPGARHGEQGSASSPACSRPAISISATISAPSQLRGAAGQHDCLYCVVDLHAITVWQEPARAEPQTTREVTAAFLAAGIDPKRTSSSTRARCRGMPSSPGSSTAWPASAG